MCTLIDFRVTLNFVSQLSIKKLELILYITVTTEIKTLDEQLLSMYELHLIQVQITDSEKKTEHMKVNLIVMSMMRYNVVLKIL